MLLVGGWFVSVVVIVIVMFIMLNRLFCCDDVGFDSLCSDRMNNIFVMRYKNVERLVFILGFY